MIKCKVVGKFDLKAFKELRNIEREKKEHESAKYDGKLFVNDKFECSQEMADYLTGNNPLNLQVVKIIEVIPEKEEITEKEVQAVAKAIVEESEERKDTVENIINEIIEESEKEKPHKKAFKKKKTKNKE